MMRGSLLILALCTAPIAKADTFTLENVSLLSGSTTYRAAQLEITDSPLSREAMQALLADATTPVPQRWAKLNAARVASPEIVSEMSAGAVTQKVTYHNVVFEQIMDGRIGRARASDATFAVTGTPNGDISGRTGLLALDAIDVPTLAHILVEGRSTPDEAARTVLAKGEISDIDVDLPNGGKGHIGRASVRGAGARALAVPMTSLVDIAPKPDADPPGPERRKALSTLFADVLTSQSLDALDLTDVSVQSAAATATIAKAGALSFSGVANGRIARAALDGLSVTGAGSGALAIGHLALLDLDVTPALSDTLAEESAARVPVRFGRIELSGVSAKSSGVGEPVAFTISDAAVDAKDWRDLSPQALQLRLGHLAFDLPKDDPRARPLLDLGYTALDLSLASDATYDAKAQQLAVTKLTAGAPGIGTADLSSLLINVGPDILGRDREKARAALSASLFKRASMLVTDNGLLGRMIETQARRSNASANDVRARWATTVRAVVMATFADNADRGTLADAAERFVRTGGRLSVVAEATTGLGLIDAMLAGGVQGLLGKVKLTAGN